MVSSTGAQTKDIGLSNCVLFQQQFNAAEHIRFFSFPPIGSASLCVSPRPPPPGCSLGAGAAALRGGRGAGFRGPAGGGGRGGRPRSRGVAPGTFQHNTDFPSLPSGRWSPTVSWLPQLVGLTSFIPRVGLLGSWPPLIPPPSWFCISIYLIGTIIITRPS